MHGHTVWWVWSKVSEQRDGPQPAHGARQVLNRDIDNLNPAWRGVDGACLTINVSGLSPCIQVMTARLFRG